MANKYYDVTKVMADLHDAERMRMVEQLRLEYGPGTTQESWLNELGHRMAGKVGEGLVALGKTLEGLAQGRTASAER